MQQHVQHTQEKFAADNVLIYGPVMAPTGAFLHLVCSLVSIKRQARMHVLHQRINVAVGAANVNSAVCNDR